MTKLLSSYRSYSGPFIRATSRLFSIKSGDDDYIFDPPDMTPPIPPYIAKIGETTKLKRARLLYQSRKRGMLENGLLLSTFASKYLSALTDEQLASYDKLINQPTNDWEIYYWVTGVTDTPDEYKSDVMNLLQKHARNEEKDSRFKQPDL